MGRSSTTTAPSTTTAQTDARVAIGNDGAQVGAFGSYYRADTNASAWNSGNTSTLAVSDSRDYSDRSTTTTVTNVTDSRDLSDRSNHYTHVTATDSGAVAGAVQMAEWNAQLLGALNENQTDAVRAIAAMGADGIQRQAEAATNLFATGSAEASAAWGHTVDKSYETIDRLLTSASATVTGAQRVATDAIQSYQPTANAEAASSSRTALYAALALGALVVLKGA